MTTIECILAAMSDGLVLPPVPLVVDGKSLEAIFQDASNGDIQLQVTNRLAKSLSPTLQLVESLDLHQAVSGLTNNPRRAAKVNRVAIVYAGKFKPHPTAFGLMFDMGHQMPWDSASTVDFTGVPREGCAVFLDAITGVRQSPNDYQSEVAFTTIHELGHIFNLQHRSMPLSFMAPSPHSRPFRSEDSAFRFDPHEKQILAQCSTSRFICPGGSAFGDLGSLAGMNVATLQAPTKPPVTLKIDIWPREFWNFEPIELDVWLHQPARKILIADVIDPGYESFVIWIEDPQGELRRYRSPRRYCWHGETITIRPSQPFRRDVSIFVESGGYTFRRAGIHKVWATLSYSKTRQIESNVVEVDVRPHAPNQDRFQEFQRALTTRSHVKALYYRRLSRTQREAKPLAEFAQAHAKTASAGAVHYALGRSALRKATMSASSARARDYLHKSQHYLQIAEQNPRLSEHRRFVAQELLQNQLSDRA